MNDYEFLPDETVLSSMLNTFSRHQTTANMIRLAISLGAVIAGGAAISLLEARTTGKNRDSIRYGLWRDVDLWFPNQESLDVYLSTAAVDRNISFRPSFGRNAIDFDITDGGPQLQVIMCRTGTPIEIISKFDFTNCAVAFDGKGFWYHKDVPTLCEQKKLGLLNDDSPFFMSRVAKYLKKGYYTVDDSIRDRLYSDLSAVGNKGIDLGKTLTLQKKNSLQEFDTEYHPIFKAVCRSECYLGRFTRSNAHASAVKVFTDEQLRSLQEKELQLANMRQSYSSTREKEYDLPYGYTASSSNSAEPNVDRLLGLC